MKKRPTIFHIDLEQKDYDRLREMAEQDLRSVSGMIKVFVLKELRRKQVK